MDARISRRQKKTSLKQEKNAARDIGGRTQPASGALSGARGDVRKMGEVRVECKYTDADFYTLKLDDLQKIKMQAIQGGLEEPVLQLGFRDPHTRRLEQFAIVPWDKSAGRTPSVRILAKEKSTRLYRDNLRLGLVGNYCVEIRFEARTTGAASFEVLHWEDYLRRRQEQ